EQSIDRERLGHETGDAWLLKQLLRSRLLGLPGNENKRRNFSYRMAVLINFPNQKKQHRAVDHRHLEIEDEQVVFFLQRQLEGVFGLGRSIDLALERCQQRFTHYRQKR